MVLKVFWQSIHIYQLHLVSVCSLDKKGTINTAQAIEAELVANSRIAPKASVGLMARRVGRIEHLGFILEDYNNYLGTRRMEQMKIEDTRCVLEYL